MITQTSAPEIETVESRYVRPLFPSLCWGAIIGGTVAAIGIHILLAMLGIGAGLAAFSPATDAHPTAAFSEETAAIWSGCALIAIFFGAVIAGRFSRTVHGGFVHGILVWSLTLIITLVMLSHGAGMVLGAGLKMFGEGLGIGSKAIATGVSDVASDGIKRNGDELSSFVNEATQSIPTNSAPKASIRAKREVGLAVAKLFAPDNDINSPDNRTALVKALVDYTQMSQADAESTVDGWIASYKDLRGELDKAKTIAEQKAKEAADQAAHDISIAGTWSFFGLLLGLIVSAGGGVLGADHAVKRLKLETVSTI